MPSNGAQEIQFRSGIAAVNSTSHLRVYTQDIFGKIRESAYEERWMDGTSQNTIATAKLMSPIAAASRDLNSIRVFYLSNGNNLMEAAYDSNRGWHDGNLNKQDYAVAPYSKIAACYLAGFERPLLRVYAQKTDNTIQEYGTDTQGNWNVFTNLGVAMPGTQLAVTSYVTSGLSIRLYHQHNNGSLVEKAYDSGSGWYNGGFKVPTAPPRAAIAATSHTVSNGVNIRVCYAVEKNSLGEIAWGDQGWQDGGLDQSTIPGPEVAVIEWGEGPQLNMRVYSQRGEFVSGVSEWAFTGGKWESTNTAIPPA